MTYAPTVLLYGRNLPLLSARKRRLESSGLSVQTVCSRQKAQAKMREHGVDVVILCHTLPRIEANYLMRCSAARWLETRLIAIREGQHGCDGRFSGQTIQVTEATTMLTAKIRELLRYTRFPTRNSQSTYVDHSRNELPFTRRCLHWRRG